MTTYNESKMVLHSEYRGLKYVLVRHECFQKWLYSSMGTVNDLFVANIEDKLLEIKLLRSYFTKDASQSICDRKAHMAISTD